jgi:hypothetical protein
VDPANTPLGGLVSATEAWVTSLQVTVPVSQVWLEGHEGAHTDETQAPLTQARPAPQVGKQAPCGTTQTAGLREVRQTAGAVQSASARHWPAGETEQADRSARAQAAVIGLTKKLLPRRRTRW